MAEPATKLEDEIKAHARSLGADLVGITATKRWAEQPLIEEDFFPQSLWPLARSVIVMGMQMPLPIVDTTPSPLHKELYDIVNRELDSVAFRLVQFLNRKGHPAFFFTRDGYVSMKALREKPQAAFSHIHAAYYAGLGTVGMNRVLLTPEFGPRVRLVSVFTAAELNSDPMMTEDLCIKCNLCAKCCPSSAIIAREDTVIGDFDVNACLGQTEALVRRRIYPCGICTKVCPIGQDRALYQEKTMAKRYLAEKDALADNPDDPHYRSWSHIRKYGSSSIAGSETAVSPIKGGN